MMPISHDEALRAHPDLARQVLSKLDKVKHGVKASEVAWFLRECHDDADEPLDEAAAADILLTGSLPCRYGLCGKIADHFGCACSVGALPVRHSAGRRH